MNTETRQPPAAADTDVGLFQPWHKISRLNRQITITEKLDGSNAQIAFWPLTPELFAPIGQETPTGCSHILNTLFGNIGMWVGCRKRWIMPGKTTDNHGFARWAVDNAEHLHTLLGEGRHFGEWYGQGIQRNYGLEEKRLALFDPDMQTLCSTMHSRGRLSDVSAVPVLYRGPMDTVAISDTLLELSSNGSRAVPGFLNPEGIIVYHHAARKSFKVTIENDGGPKSLFTKGQIDDTSIVVPLGTV